MTYVSLLRKLKAQGYRICLFFLWIPNVEIALARIADRVRRGGHNIPKEVIHRRFHKGLQNLFKLYRPHLDSLTIFENSGTAPRVIAVEEGKEFRIIDQDLFAQLSKVTEVS